MSVGMTPRNAAMQAGWFEWFGYWLHFDLVAAMHQERPWYWKGTVKDLCLVQGIEHEL